VLQREILQTYGFEYLFTLNNLEKLGLLRKQEGKQIFPLLRKNLRLIVEDLDETTPNDIAYVYSGYAPLSVRLVQHAVRGGSAAGGAPAGGPAASGWRAHEELLRGLPGPTFEETQTLPPGVVGAGAGGAPPVTLVFYIGGITFTEIAALRFLSAQDAPNRDYVIATTKLISGDSIIDSIIERIEPPATRK
jgi:hypothetical protein